MSSVAARPNVKGTVKQVMSGELFSGLLLDDADQRALALESVLGKVVDEDTRVLWVGNPLRSPLTIERFLIQIVGPEVDLRSERSPVEIAHLIAKPVGQATRLLIVVQQPETINAETLDQLVEVGGHLGGEPVQLQFLFVGPSNFQVPQLAKPEITSFPPQKQEEQEPIEWPVIEPTQPRSRLSDIAPLLVLIVSITAAAIAAIVANSHDSSQAPAATAPPPVSASAPVVSAPVATPPPSPGPGIDPEIVLLRREFDTFLSKRNPPVPPMTDAEKDALFNGFLTYHRRE